MISIRFKFLFFSEDLLQAYDDYIRIWQNKKVVIIPYSQIISFTISWPKGKWKNGIIALNLGGAVKSHLRVTSNYVINETNDVNFYFTVNDINIVKEFECFLSNKLAEINSFDKDLGFSSADEIKKFKELLDAGIITKEEFEIKKKELLGI